MKKASTAVLVLSLLAFTTGSSLAAGAIAVDDSVGESASETGYGFATGEDTREDAAREALKQCRAHGNRDCKVVVRFDKCGAYANNRRVYGVGWGRTLAEASNMALDKCGAGNCRIVVADCD
jgi:hypothetical protein